MKKRYVLLAALLTLSVFAAGCGKKEEEVIPQVPVTATPAPESAAPKGDLVDMQTSTDETSAIKNVLGQKSATAAKFVLINKTGGEISTIHIRPHTEDDDDESWGEELVKGKFVLKDGDKAVYYYEKDAKDDNGNPVSSYDVRIDFTDEDRYECFFRKLPFSSITQLTLRMDKETDLPFATYTSGTGKKEISTLNEVKKRVGYYDDEEDYDDSENNNSDSLDDVTLEEPTENPSGEPQEPGETEPDPGTDNPGGEDPVSVATGFIGQSLDALKGACGEPTGSDYQDEPETGKTGYHYYSIGDSTFTVSTTVDENGNEIVAGVW